MRHTLIAFLLFAATPAFADDAGKAVDVPGHATVAAKPACGKDVPECQKAVDDLTQRLSQMTLAYQAARQQRDSEHQAAADAQVQQYIAQQSSLTAKK